MNTNTNNTAPGAAILFKLMREAYQEAAQDAESAASAQRAAAANPGPRGDEAEEHEAYIAAKRFLEIAYTLRAAEALSNPDAAAVYAVMIEADTAASAAHINALVDYYVYKRNTRGSPRTLRALRKAHEIAKAASNGTGTLIYRAVRLGFPSPWVAAA
jgi:hypothetical protein